MAPSIKTATSIIAKTNTLDERFRTFPVPSGEESLSIIGTNQITRSPNMVRLYGFIGRVRGHGHIGSPQAHLKKTFGAHSNDVSEGGRHQTSHGSPMQDALRVRRTRGTAWFGGLVLEWFPETEWRNWVNQTSAFETSKQVSRFSSWRLPPGAAPHVWDVETWTSMLYIGAVVAGARRLE